MGALLFKLHDVPQDEADQIRQMLDKADIAYYETTAGNWGVSLAAIWLVQKDDLERAKHLLKAFQQQWHRDVLTEREIAPPETLSERIKREPLKMLLALVAVGAILYLSIMPFTGAWS